MVWFVDQGRLELSGVELEGTRLRGRAGASVAEDVCWQPKHLAHTEQCAFGVAHDLPPDTLFEILAPARPAEKAAAAPDAAREAPPIASFRAARIVLDRVLPLAAAVDLTNGAGRIALLHPEAVSAVDCGQARCELSGAAVQVGAVAGTATALTLRIRLAPRYVVMHNDVPEPWLTRTVAVVHCQAAVISGPPPRRAEGTRIVVRLDARCGAEARGLSWTINGDHADVERVVRETAADNTAVDVQLRAGDIEEAQVTLMATRPEPDGSVIAVAHQETRAAPQLRVALELPGFGKVDFVPTNREAVLRTAPVSDGARLVPLPVEGAYRVRFEGELAHVQAEDGAGGVVALRFGFRVDGLPAAFAGTNLAVLTESLQRPIREASVPAPLRRFDGGAAGLARAPVCRGRPAACA